MTKITIILIYFGKLPKWMPFFLHTCRRNPTIDFLFFCDDSASIEDAANIRLVPFDLAAFNILASKQLGFDVHLDSPYKICDLKPAFGRIFQDYLGAADFWGYSDLDLVFGDIRKFITEEILTQNEVITARTEYLVGHFTLYRNRPDVNLLYTRSPQHKLIFTTPVSCCFDECVYLWKDLIAGRPILELKAPAESITHVVVKQQQAGLLRAYFSKLALEQDRYDPQGKLQEWTDTVCWDDGKLTNLNEDREYMYFHFHFLKKKPGFHCRQGEEPGNLFYIQPTGFTFTVGA